MYTKPSKSIVRQKIYDKIYNQCFNSIVKEAFVHSLVYDIDEAEEGSVYSLMQYVDACCEHLGGGKAILENAIKTHPTGPKKTLLMDIQKVCEAAADEVADRATSNEDKSTDVYDDAPLEELVRSAGFTKDEFNKFQKNVDNLGMDEIGGIIQDKVRNVLQNEHNIQTRVDKIDTEITNMVNQNNKEREEAKAEMQPDDLDNPNYDEDEDLDNASDAKTDEEAPEEVPADDTEDSKDDSEKDKESKDSSDEDDSDMEPDDAEKDELNPNAKKSSKDKSKDESDDSEKDSKDTSDDESDNEDKPKKSMSKEEVDEALNVTIKEAFMQAIGVPTSSGIEHRSYFNTLQIAALENILWTEDASVLNPDEISYDRLANLTMEAGLPEFRVNKTAMESLSLLGRIKSDEVRQNAMMFKSDVMDAATTDAITVYTMMECFHTLNLIPGGYQNVRATVESVLPMNLKITNCKREATKYVKELGARAAKESAIVSTPVAAMKLLNELDFVHNVLTNCNEAVNASATLESLNASAETVRKKLTAMESTTPTAKKEDPFVLRQKKDISIAQCNKIASMTKNIGPLAESIVFEGTSDPNFYDVTINRKNGINAHTYVTLESITGNISKDLATFVKESQLSDKNMPQIILKKNDGKGTTEVLKY